MSAKSLCFLIVRMPRSFVHPFVQTNVVTTISHEWLSILDETYREYSLAPADDLVRFLRSKVKVTQQAVEMVGASTSMPGCRSPFLGRLPKFGS